MPASITDPREQPSAVWQLSRYGAVRLGPEHSRPEFSTGAWAAMLFAAGIGADLFFYSVYEPVTQYLSPPVGAGQTVEAAREATAWTLFHYGISGRGMYSPAFGRSMPRRDEHYSRPRCTCATAVRATT